jgi:hypothetical protein
LHIFAKKNAVKIFRTSLPAKLTLWLLILQSVNLCIDPPDPFPSHIAEDLSINEIESFVELIWEEICVVEDAICESDDPDEEKNAAPAHPYIAFVRHIERSYVIPSPYLSRIAYPIDRHNARLRGLKPEPFNPPPEIIS